MNASAVSMLEISGSNRAKGSEPSLLRGISADCESWEFSSSPSVSKAELARCKTLAGRFFFFLSVLRVFAGSDVASGRILALNSKLEEEKEVAFAV